MARAKVTVTVDVRALKKLRADAKKVLQALDHAGRDEARRILDVSAFLVPRGDPTDESDLAGSAQLLGPEYNLEAPLSTTWLAAYQHPAGGAIHEGFHWGAPTQPPPHWMKTAFKGARGRMRKSVARVLAEYLARHFS